MRVRDSSCEVASRGAFEVGGNGPAFQKRRSHEARGRRERNAYSFPLGLTRPCPFLKRNGKPLLSYPSLFWVPSRVGEGEGVGGGGCLSFSSLCSFRSAEGGQGGILLPFLPPPLFSLCWGGEVSMYSRWYVLSARWDEKQGSPSGCMHRLGFGAFLSPFSLLGREERGMFWGSGGVCRASSGVVPISFKRLKLPLLLFFSF